MSTTELEQAMERMKHSFRVVFEATEASNNASAEVARLTLLSLAEEDERICGLSFETEYQYDDEGGYFQTANVYPIMKEEGDLDVDLPFSDEMNSFDPATLCTLCGVSTDITEGQITIEEARAKRF